MVSIASLEDIAALQESYDVECKLAGGKDGTGELPKDFWPTYSAFANSHGGEVLLGLEEKNDSFRVQGIARSEKVIGDLWSLLNDPQKVSTNLLKEKDVQTLQIEGKTIIHIHIPRAARKERPVYINNNPMTGTYRRSRTGDYHCDQETVRRMLAEQVEESRDVDLLKGYNLEDIDADSFNDYRRIFAAGKPDHPWNQLTPIEFLRSVGGWGQDRDAGFGALTKAGLLMFGMLPSIREVFPNYMLDYQERDEARSDARWTDRLTLDGSWSGNLFDFYRRVIRKLTADLKLPFSMKGDRRSDETPIHEALREALVNTLVHADYSGRASVLIIKRPDMFGFRNPGLMRVPQEIAVQGGESDCRNRTLHQLFRFIGLGEQAGSGIPKIYQGWDSQHWRKPRLTEEEVPSDQTVLELPMLGLFPEHIVRSLRKRFGPAFDTLPNLERLILATAALERTVTHSRMGEITTDHAHDLTKAFRHLCRIGWLQSTGRTRATIYFLADEARSAPAHRRANTGTAEMGNVGYALPDSAYLETGSAHLTHSSAYLSDSSAHLNDPQRTHEGWLRVEGLDRPLIDRLDLLDESTAGHLLDISAESREKGKISREQMESLIVQLCRRHYITPQVLENLLQRKVAVLRQNYLRPMVKEGRLTMAFPATPTHPQQAYTAIH